MSKTKLTALLGGTLVALQVLSGCNFDESAGSELKCDSQGCQVSVRPAL